VLVRVRASAIDLPLGEAVDDPMKMSLGPARQVHLDGDGVAEDAVERDGPLPCLPVKVELKVKQL
jgi:hypothetical protein